MTVVVMVSVDAIAMTRGTATDVAIVTVMTRDTATVVARATDVVGTENRRVDAVATKAPIN